jgi:calcineurin-like phosphoesterase family protein
VLERPLRNLEVVWRVFELRAIGTAAYLYTYGTVLKFNLQRKWNRRFFAELSMQARAECGYFAFTFGILRAEGNQMRTWFTSDHHYGHANIIKYCDRPFADVHEMNFGMTQAWNRVVAPDDLVYYLGDLAMNAQLVPSLLEQLNGNKILIPGNHDKCWEKKDKKKHWREFYLDAGFQSIEQSMRLNIARNSVLLNHFPYRNESTPEQKYFQQRPIDEGGWLIHGHVHNRWKCSGRQINVSVEMWNFEPVSMEDIIAIIEAGPTKRSEDQSEGYSES